MPFNQAKYTKEYNKKRYQTYQFRVKLEEKELIQKLNEQESKNEFIIRALKNYISPKTYSLAKIKSIILPIFSKYDIEDVYLFGSYARGEANENSDVDIYCEKGKIKTLFDQMDLEEKLETALDKKVDLVFATATADESFLNNIKKDYIKLC